MNSFQQGLLALGLALAAPVQSKSIIESDLADIRADLNMLGEESMLERGSEGMKDGWSCTKPETPFTSICNSFQGGDDRGENSDACMNGYSCYSKPWGLFDMPYCNCYPNAGKTAAETALQNAGSLTNAQKQAQIAKATHRIVCNSKGVNNNKCAGYRDPGGWPTSYYGSGFCKKWITTEGGNATAQTRWMTNCMDTFDVNDVNDQYQMVKMKPTLSEECKGIMASEGCSSEVVLHKVCCKFAFIHETDYQYVGCTASNGVDFSTLPRCQQGERFDAGR